MVSLSFAGEVSLRSKLKPGGQCLASVVVLCCPKTLCISKFGYIKAVVTDSKCPCYRDIRLRVGWRTAGAHIPERATPILGLCYGVFTDQFIFRDILGHFFPRKWNLRHIYERIRCIRYQKGKGNVIKGKKLSFLGVADWFVGLKRYSKFAAKPFQK